VGAYVAGTGDCSSHGGCIGANVKFADKEELVLWGGAGVERWVITWDWYPSLGNERAVPYWQAFR